MKTHKLQSGKCRAALAAMAMYGCIGSTIAAPGPVRFLVGKTVNYRQAADGGLSLLNYHFFAELTPPPGQEGGTASLVDPDGRVIAYQRSGSKLSIPGTRDLVTLAELNAYAPNGTYTVQFNGPAAPTVKGTIQLAATEDVFADPVRITLLQDGQPVSPNAVKSGKALTVSWSPFRKGRSDPNGLVDDLIFAKVGDCHGRIIARSSGSGKPALTYRSASYTIAANTLEAGATYQVDVEHAPLHTRRSTDVPAGVSAITMATYPATTYLDFRTEGAGSNTCPTIPYRMDNGQSDRPRAPVNASTMRSEPGAGEKASAAVKSVTDQVTFLYYDDLTAPRKFYSETLGLAPYFQRAGVSLYHPTSGSTIGIVKLLRPGITPSVKGAAVMVSIVTDDVAEWYKKLKQDPGIPITKKLYDHPRVPIRAFQVEDPGGYAIEFFQWLPEQE